MNRLGTRIDNLRPGGAATRTHRHTAGSGLARCRPAVKDGRQVVLGQIGAIRPDIPHGSGEFHHFAVGQGSHDIRDFVEAPATEFFLKLAQINDWPLRLWGRRIVGRREAQGFRFVGIWQ